MSIAIVGSGRVAQSLGRLLATRGEAVEAVASRDLEHARAAAAFIGQRVRPVEIGEIPAFAGHVLIAVSDDALEAVAGSLAAGNRRGGVVLHTSGVSGPETLAPLASTGASCGAFHPLQTISTPEQGVRDIPGSAFGVTADGPALDWALHLSARLDGQALRIRAEDRALYHSAAVFAGNFPAALVAASVDLLARAGLDREAAAAAIVPLIRAAVGNISTQGLRSALTGPLVRGDVETIARHLEALAVEPRSVGDLYRAASRSLLPFAAERGVGREALEAIERLLDQRTET
jgi:predicted short-subunit dehydrogenase-like oxidoreductase (DUF2520 family)